ncbi:hypothetical protein [Bradyrhizobium lablabi]|uniref:hypothetical protein n=1 Tax=Bradyrhizobium lablabi TaxID=722472 RepID=UPI0012AC1F37|nr:hypothetical protein [Bradyrhizobium lablabi]
MIATPLCRLRHQSNNVASIWLLRGDAGTLIVRNCDAAATAPICSINVLFLPKKQMVLRYAFVSAFGDPVQGSLKSDRASEPLLQAKRSNQKS